MLLYRSLAESWRVMSEYRVRNRGEIVANCIRASMQDAWSIISFFYPKDGIGKRLSDEDFREVFFLLTDAYPNEIESNPDPIDLLVSLSETEVTTGHAKSIVSRLHNILEAEDNEVRSWLIRPLFETINKRDLHPLFLRMSVRASPIRRRDAIMALAMAYDYPFHHVRTSVNLLGLENTVRDLSLNGFNYSKIRPLCFQPLLIPIPVLVKSPSAVTFTKCYAEEVEGTWVTLHHDKKKTMVFDSSGADIPEIEDIRSWALNIGLLDGVYLCDYAERRDNSFLLIDWLNPTDSKLTYASRRKRFDTLPSWAIKPMIEMDLPYHPESSPSPYLLRNARGILTYENTIEEVVLLNPQIKYRILRVLSGKVVKSNSGGVPTILWKLGARDGFDYYPVCELESPHDFLKDIRNFLSPFKRLVGEAIKITSPLFVRVNVITSGWGDLGCYLKGEIIKVESNAGISDCMGVEELGYVEDESE